MKLTNHNINDLIRLCIAKNQQAQMEVYNRYYKAMYNTAIRIVKDSYAAEDIMQDSFLIAFNKLKNLTDVTLFGAWLKRIVINESLNFYKQNNKHNQVALDDVIYKIESDNVEDNLDINESKTKDILKAMTLLKDNYRIALSLSLIEGYDNEEISEIMNISHANCRTTISRAKNALRKNLSV